jgi:D-xylose transport system substrate-binding protein
MLSMRKIISVLLACLMILTVATACKQDDSTTSPVAPKETSSAPDTSSEAIYDKPAKVYFSIPDSMIQRYLSFDAPALEKWLAVYAPNATLTVLDAQSNPQNELSQIEAAVSAGMDYLVYIAADSQSATGVLDLMKEENISFHAMAHTAFGGPVPHMLTMPFPTIAEQYVKYMEENILSNDIGRPYNVAYIKGAPGALFTTQLDEVYQEAFNKWGDKINIVYENEVNGWTAKDSQPVAEQALTKTQNNVDIFISMNDDLLTGITAALVEQGLQGKVHLIGGCDVTLEGVARVQAEWQVGDVTPDYDEMGRLSAELCATVLAGKDTSHLVNGTEDNKFVEGGVPTIFVEPVFVTKDTIKKDLIDTGIYTQEEIDQAAANMK